MSTAVSKSTHWLRLDLVGRPAVDNLERSLVALEDQIDRREAPESLLVDFTRFEGWDPNSAWAPELFDRHRFSSITRVGMIGSAEWKNWMNGFLRPFEASVVRFFRGDEREEASRWLSDGEWEPGPMEPEERKDRSP